MAHDGHDDDGHHHDPHHHHGHAHPSVDQHRATAPTAVATYVVTCSDSRAPASDESGAEIRKLLESAGHTVLGAVVVRDDAAQIRGALDAALSKGARAVLFTGGTGLSTRDVTVETLTPLFERHLPGFGELFRMLSFEQIGSAAMLSRAVAGVMRGAVVFAMPGSPAAVKLALEELILPELGHVARELSR